jgi:hypothetical protein
MTKRNALWKIIYWINVLEGSQSVPKAWIIHYSRLARVDVEMILESQARPGDDEQLIWCDRGGYRLTVAGRDVLNHLDVRDPQMASRFTDEVLSGMTAGGNETKKENAALCKKEYHAPSTDYKMVKLIDESRRERKSAGQKYVTQGRTFDCAYCGFISLHRTRDSEMCLDCEKKSGLC